MVAVEGKLGMGSVAVEMDFMMSPFGIRTLMEGFMGLTGWHSKADLYVS